MNSPLPYETAIAACARAGVDGVRAALRPFPGRNLPYPYDEADPVIQAYWRNLATLVLRGRWRTLDVNDRAECPGFDSAVRAEATRHAVLATPAAPHA